MTSPGWTVAAAIRTGVRACAFRMSEDPPTTATSMSNSPVTTLRSRRLRFALARGIASTACIGLSLHVVGEDVQELLDAEGRGVVALALEHGLGERVLARQLGEGQVVRVRDKRGHRPVESKEQVV